MAVYYIQGTVAGIEDLSGRLRFAMRLKGTVQSQAEFENGVVPVFKRMLSASGVVTGRVRGDTTWHIGTLTAGLQITGTLRYIRYLRGQVDGVVVPTGGLPYFYGLLGPFDNKTVEAIVTPTGSINYRLIPDNVLTIGVGVNGGFNIRTRYKPILIEVIVDALVSGFASPGVARNTTLEASSEVTGRVARHDVFTPGAAEGNVTGTMRLVLSLRGTVTATSEVTGRLRVRHLIRGDVEAPSDNYGSGAPIPSIRGTVTATCTPTGTVASVYAMKSPAFVLFRGETVLRAGMTTPWGSFGSEKTLQITLDPHLINTAVSSTVLYRRQGYELHFDVVSRLLRFRVYGSENEITHEPVDFVERWTNTPITTRVTYFFTFSAGELHAYRGADNDDGAFTSVGAGATSNPANSYPVYLGGKPDYTAMYRGGIYTVIMWDEAFSPAIVALFDGSNGTVSVGHRRPSLVLAWTSQRIIQDPANYRMVSWEDTQLDSPWVEEYVGSANRVLAHGDDSSKPPLVYNEWDSTLVDVAFGTFSLTTTYGFAAPFRTWTNGAQPPYLPNNFRKYMNDITVFGFFRKTTGTVNFTIFALYGLRLAYNLSSKELYLVVGADDTSTLANYRYSFGTDRFPVENIAHRFVLRWNSELQQLDVFIDDVIYSWTRVATNLWEDSEGLTFSDQGDFSYAQVSPACLPNEQIIRVIRTKSYTGFTFFTATREQADDLYPRVGAAFERGDPAEIAIDGIPFDTTNKARLALPDPHDRSTDGGYGVTDAIDDRERILQIPTYRDPNARVTSVSATVDHVVTVSAVAGPTDAVDCYTWWEIETTAGSTELLIMADRKETAQNFGSLKAVTDQFPIPRGMDLHLKRIRFALQSVRDAKQMWRSPWVAMVGEAFSNNPPTIIYTPPETVTVEPPAVAAERQIAAQVARTVRLKKAASVAQNLKTSARSRYKLTPVYDTDKGPSYALMTELADFFAPDRDTVVHVVEAGEEGMPDQLMVNLFGEGYEDLWWIVTYLNSMVDPTTELVTGMRVLVPKQESIARFLARRPEVELKLEG